MYAQTSPALRIMAGWPNPNTASRKTRQGRTCIHHMLTRESGCLACSSHLHNTILLTFRMPSLPMHPLQTYQSVSYRALLSLELSIFCLVLVLFPFTHTFNPARTRSSSSFLVLIQKKRITDRMKDSNTLSLFKVLSTL